METCQKKNCGSVVKILYYHFVISNWSDINISTNKTKKQKTNKKNKKTNKYTKHFFKKESFMEFLHTHHKILAYPTRPRH
jgi:hypothetical protein